MCLCGSRQEVRRARGGRVVAGRDPVHAGVGLAALRRLHAAGAARARAPGEVQVNLKYTPIGTTPPHNTSIGCFYKIQDYFLKITRHLRPNTRFM